LISAWRIVKRKHAKSAFTGDGARLFGGRWNTPGIAVVYTAESQALAALEMVAHLESAELLEHYVAIEVRGDVPFERLEAAALPRRWQSYPAPAKLAAFGDRWAAECRSVALRVPSVLIPEEHNFLLNPAHPDFARLSTGKPVPFRFDRRLAR